jgi:hypothetical protein
MPSFIDDATTLPVEHVLGLGKHPAGRTHGLVKGDIPGGPKRGVPKMTSGSTAPSPSAASMEKDAPPDGPAELAGSSVATSLVVTLVATPGNTSEAGDPPLAAAYAAAPAAIAASVTGTPPAASSLSWASTVSWGSATWAAPATLAPQLGATC